MKMKKLKEFVFPKSLAEAGAILKKNKGSARLAAGSTALTQITDNKTEILVDAMRLPLKYIKKTKTGIAIGARTVLNDIYKSSVLKSYAGGFFSEIAGNTASNQVRNMITIGGNCAQPFPWSNMPLALLCVDAKIKIFNSGKTRTLKFSEFYENGPLKSLKIGDIITEFILPAASGVKSSFYKLSKTRTDYAIISAAAAVKIKGGKVTDIKIAIGQAQARPTRVYAVEKFLKNKAFNAANIKEAAQRGAKTLKMISDLRASAEYRSKIADKVIITALENCK